MSVGFGLPYLCECAELFEATIDVPTINLVLFQVNNDGSSGYLWFSFSFRQTMS